MTAVLLTRDSLPVTHSSCWAYKEGVVERIKREMSKAAVIIVVMVVSFLMMR